MRERAETRFSARQSWEQTRWDESRLRPRSKTWETSCTCTKESSPPTKFERWKWMTRWSIPAHSTLSMPKKHIMQLGLVPFRSRVARTSAGLTTFQVHGGVRLTIQGRECNADVVELPDDCPVLIGQVPFELLDFVVDPKGQRLIGNPAHGGEQMLEMY